MTADFEDFPELAPVAEDLQALNIRDAKVRPVSTGGWKPMWFLGYPTRAGEDRFFCLPQTLSLRTTEEAARSALVVMLQGIAAGRRAAFTKFPPDGSFEADSAAVEMTVRDTWANVRKRLIAERDAAR